MRKVIAGSVLAAAAVFGSGCTSATEDDQGEVVVMMRKTLAAMAIAAAIAGGALSGAGIASAAKELGGVNIQRWCASTQHAVLATTSVTRGSGAYSWRCVYRYDTGLPGASNKTVQEGVDMNAACRLQYGNGAWSKPLNPNDANSWRCYR